MKTISLVLLFLLPALPSLAQSPFSDSTHRWVNGIWYDLEKPADGIGFYLDKGEKRVNFPKQYAFYAGGFPLFYESTHKHYLDLNLQLGFYFTSKTFLQLNFNQNEISEHHKDFTRRYLQNINSLTLSYNYLFSNEVPIYLGAFVGFHNLQQYDNYRSTVFFLPSAIHDRMGYQYQSAGLVLRRQDRVEQKVYGWAIVLTPMVWYRHQALQG